MGRIDAFVMLPSQADVLSREAEVDRVCVVEDPLTATSTLKTIAEAAEGEFILLYTKPTDLSLVSGALERMLQIADDTDAVFLYADRFISKEGVVTGAPVIDCQEGALRDDFDFGGLLLLGTCAFKEAVSSMTEDYSAAGLYDLRLRMSRLGKLEHIGEYLYYEIETDLRSSGEKLFDYVDPKNRGVQLEMEDAVTRHLKAVGAYLAPVFKDVDFSGDDFPVEASVVIPCKNRVRTIGDAIRSALSQKTSFPYNVIVVDDNSTDGTVDVIKSFGDDSRLVYIAQDKSYHAIGGNWNAAVHDPRCGRFALQLDSDDMYSDDGVVQRFVEAFYAENCAMVVGTYRITDFDLNPLPPFVVDHKEWTLENGRNNALRVNGFGAPRGFWTPLLRKLNFPVTKYGEDYAVALRISREYRIGRIWEVMYNCRRWENNSDGNLSVEKVNSNNFYKDRIRTWELLARKKQNATR